MLELLKRASIFIVVTETLIQCLPDSSYKKYVRVLIQFMLAGMLLGPILLFFTGLDKADWERRVREWDLLYDNITESAEDFELPSDGELPAEIRELMQEAEEAEYNNNERGQDGNEGGL